jgi:hypothetical protein
MVSKVLEKALNKGVMLVTIWAGETHVKIVHPISQTTMQIRGRILSAIRFAGICMMANAIV